MQGNESREGFTEPVANERSTMHVIFHSSEKYYLAIPFSLQSHSEATQRENESRIGRK